MLICNFYYFINIHIIMTANLCQFIGKCNINISISILNHFRHFSGTNICNDYFSLAKACINLFYSFTNFLTVTTNRPAIIFQFIYHISRDNPLGGMYNFYIVMFIYIVFIYERSYKYINRFRRNCRFNNNNAAFLTNFQ